MVKMMEGGLFGRKNGRGFYDYAHGKTKPIVKINQLRMNDSMRMNSGETLQRRMVLLMINESARCLEEQLVPAPEDVDFAMIMGTGFAPFHGGALRYADSLGAPFLVDHMQQLASNGEHQFAPCGLLMNQAAHGSRFYDN